MELSSAARWPLDMGRLDRRDLLAMLTAILTATSNDPYGSMDRAAMILELADKYVDAP